MSKYSLYRRLENLSWMVRTVDNSKDSNKPSGSSLLTESLLAWDLENLSRIDVQIKKNFMVILRYITYGIREKVTTLGLNRATLIS